MAYVSPKFTPEEEAYYQNLFRRDPVQEAINAEAQRIKDEKFNKLSKEEQMAQIDAMIAQIEADDQVVVPPMPEEIVLPRTQPRNKEQLRHIIIDIFEKYGNIFGTMEYDTNIDLSLIWQQNEIGFGLQFMEQCFKEAQYAKTMRGSKTFDQMFDEWMSEVMYTRYASDLDCYHDSLGEAAAERTRRR
jgi:hypothetical protein